MSARNRSGFSLIEILVAMGAFILVFLTGSGGLMRLMMQQTNNQQSAVAASAAMLIADWHATLAMADLSTTAMAFKRVDQTITDSTYKLAQYTGHIASDLSAIKFKGAKPESVDEFYYFNQSGLVRYPGRTTAELSLTSYRNLVFSLSTASAVVGTSGTGTSKFRVATFWYGDYQSAVTPVADTYVFVGRYLIPESF